MHVGVEEAGRNELSFGVDHPIDAAFESFADVQNPVALEHDLCVSQERMLAALMADDPRRLDLGTHAVSPRSSAVA
jgi:hypothetical protein